MELCITEKGEEEEKLICTNPWDLPTQISLLTGKKADHFYSSSLQLPSAYLVFKLF